MPLSSSSWFGMSQCNDSANSDVDEFSTENQHESNLFSDQLSSEIVILIASYLDLRSLYCFARIDSFMIKLLFNMDRNRVMKLGYLKTVIKKQKKQVTQNELIQSDSLIEEYSKEEDCNFTMTQEQVWKNLVCYYFPQFKKDLTVKNWMHIMRRRVAHLKLYAPEHLPLGNSIPREVFSLDSKKTSRNFIEGCEFNYKCPLTIEMTDSTYDCTVCNKIVYYVDNEISFKTHASQGHCIYYKNIENNIEFMGDIYVPPVTGRTTGISNFFNFLN
ncbi:predicted protein [Naegleria gruberi]|uniref:Predicted protein n=1 Tax=Naegleria gruberi TaxID=5762 RepID=D2VXJ7_NAEGR|nr:uncharacterized protein NAEGRDRAFT_73773 [Naegleria gruberi]EFC38451.1 predicted protein [Naegleria gruberi]|eukprot:XP_002671195.1 predicted protein [Naegleria gruberi strain NEG-M]